MKVRSVAIVGAGVAGLAAGVHLARRGLRVRVFEAAGKVGGCCGSTRIEGFTFHDGAIYLGVPGLLDAAFARLGLDRAALVPLHSVATALTAHLPDGSAVSVGRREVRVRRDGVSVSCGAEVERFLARWRPLARVLVEEVIPHEPSLLRVLRGAWHLPKLRGTVAEEIRRGFADEAVRAGLGGALLFAGASPEHLPAPLVIGLVSMLDEGLFLPVGGMSRIPEVLGDALVACGGELRLDAPVRRVTLDRGRASGVELSDGERVACDAVLSTASGMATFERLVAPEHAPASMRRKVRDAPLSHRAVAVQLGLRGRLEVESHSTSILPMLGEQGAVISGAEPGRWPNWAVPTATAPEMAPAGGSVVEMFCPVPAGTDRASVDRVAEELVGALGRRHRLDVVARRVRGPDDLERELLLHGGALYGLSPAADLRAQFPHRTPVPGLFLAGQTTYPGFGVPMATMSGVLAAEAIGGA